MNTTIQYIEQLLYKHDCVILPAFGGFVANYKSATVNQLQGKFAPPSKLIGFNKNLLNNDGLLANYISTQEGINYPEALEKLKQVVQHIKLQLQENKAVVLPNIGQLYVDANNSLRFEPTDNRNFLLDSIGLPAFNLPTIQFAEEKPVQREVIVTPPLVEVEKETPVIALKAEKEGKIIPILKKVAYAAAMIPFIAYLMWLPAKTELFKGKNFSYADLNPFSDKICTAYKIRIKTISDLDIPPVESLLQELNNPEAELTTISLFSEEDPYYNESEVITVRLKNSVIPPESTNVATSSKKIVKYHIIAGCFQEYRNAEKLSAKLRKKGYSSAIIDKKNGLFRVSFQSFANKREAKRMLVEVKKTDNPSAWLLVE